MLYYIIQIMCCLLMLLDFRLVYYIRLFDVVFWISFFLCVICFVFFLVYFIQSNPINMLTSIWSGAASSLGKLRNMKYLHSDRGCKLPVISNKPSSKLNVLRIRHLPCHHKFSGNLVEERGTDAGRAAWAGFPPAPMPSPARTSSRRSLQPSRSRLPSSAPRCSHGSPGPC